MRNLINGGFAGPIYPVNGRGGTVFDLPAFASIAELPEAPDLALVAVGAAHVNGVIEQCGERGIPVALVVAAGFSEAGEAGAAAEAELVKTARDCGVTLIGPNCMGLLATHSRLHAVGFLELRPQPGGLSIISQSGNIGVQLVTRAERRGVGIDKYVTVGNQASTSALDVLDALGDDPETAAVLVYLEEVGDGRRFIDVMRRITRKKPVVVLPGGMTDYGRRAAASHTGAMAGSTDVFLAATRQTGCLVRTGPDESLDLALCLSALPLPAGRRVAVMTLGGGWGVLAADELARNDLELAALEPHVLAALDELLPGYWCRSNPVDLVAAVGPDLAASTLTMLAESEAVDAVVVLGILRSPSTGWTSDDPSGRRRAGRTRPRQLQPRRGRLPRARDRAHGEHGQADHQRPPAPARGRDLPGRRATRSGHPLLAGRRGARPRRHGLVRGVRRRTGGSAALLTREAEPSMIEITYVAPVHLGGMSSGIYRRTRSLMEVSGHAGDHVVRVEALLRPAVDAVRLGVNRPVRRVLRDRADRAGSVRCRHALGEHCMSALVRCHGPHRSGLQARAIMAGLGAGGLCGSRLRRRDRASNLGWGVGMRAATPLSCDAPPGEVAYCIEA